VRPQIEELRDIEQQEFRPAVLRCLSKGDPAPQMTFHKIGRDEPYQPGRNVCSRIDELYYSMIIYQQFYLQKNCLLIKGRPFAFIACFNAVTVIQWPLFTNWTCTFRRCTWYSWYLVVDGLISVALMAHVGPVLIEPVVERIVRWCHDNVIGEPVPVCNYTLAERIPPHVKTIS